MHAHIHTLSHTPTYTHLHTPSWYPLSFVKRGGDLYRAEKQVGWHFGALALGEGFERKYIQLCLWNVLARMCKDFELSPRLCSCWTPVTVACAFPFIWQHADSNIFLNTTKSVPYHRLSLSSLGALQSQQQMSLSVGATFAGTRRWYNLLKVIKTWEDLKFVVCSYVAVRICSLVKNSAFVFVPDRWRRTLWRTHHKRRAYMQQWVSACSWF